MGVARFEVSYLSMPLGITQQRFPAGIRVLEFAQAIDLLRQPVRSRQQLGRHRAAPENQRIKPPEFFGERILGEVEEKKTHFVGASEIRHIARGRNGERHGRRRSGLLVSCGHTGARRNGEDEHSAE